MVKPIAPSARRFRALFWLVVALGALPSLVSGAMLSRSYRAATLCAPVRPIDGPGELAARVRWERLHDLGRWGAMLAGLLVLGYAAAWAYEAGIARRARVLVMALVLGLLLPGLGVAVWTGRALPWRLLGPMVWLGARDQTPGVLLGRAMEEVGGPEYCAEHRREVSRLRLGYFAHLGGGALALLLTLGLCDLGARWRAARNQRPD